MSLDPLPSFSSWRIRRRQTKWDFGLQNHGFVVLVFLDELFNERDNAMF